MTFAIKRIVLLAWLSVVGAERRHLLMQLTDFGTARAQRRHTQPETRRVV